jgi:hypothetical protein
MKKLIAVFSILFIASAFSAASFAADVDVSGKIYLDYSITSVPVETSENAFDISRVYLTFKSKLADNVDARVTTDMKRFSATTEADTINGYLGTYIKYAYLEMTDVIPTATLLIGQHGLPWVGFSEKVWGFRYVAKSFSDEEGKLTSADLGLGVKGKVLDKQVEYAASFVNGTGYKAEETNPDKDLEARVSVSPAQIKGLGVSVGGRIGGTPTSKRNRYMGIISYGTPLFTVAGEYLSTDDAEKLGSGAAVYGNVSILDMATLFARASQFDPDMDTNNDDHTRVILGAEKGIADGVKLALDYQRLAPNSASSKSDMAVVKANMEIKF